MTTDSFNLSTTNDLHKIKVEFIGKDRRKAPVDKSSWEDNSKSCIWVQEGIVWVNWLIMMDDSLLLVTDTSTQEDEL